MGPGANARHQPFSEQLRLHCCPGHSVSTLKLEPNTHVSAKDDDHVDTSLTMMMMMMMDDEDDDDDDYVYTQVGRNQIRPS